MINVYVQNINSFPNYPGSGEVRLFSIPMTSNQERPFLNFTMNNELGNAGSLDFTVDAKSQYIDIWRHMRTLVRVEYDGETMFFGRVLTIDRDMFRSKKIHCEGAYTFFMDSVFEGKEKGFNIMLHEYLENLIEAHNVCMTDTPEKKIYVGELPGHYSAGIADDQKVPDEKKYFAANKGYKSVKEWLDELVSNYAGSMRVRYNDADNKLYLDWMRNYYAKGAINQVMSVSSNTVDLSDTIEVDNIFTHVLPVGANWKYSDGSSGGNKGLKGQFKVDTSASPSAGGVTGSGPTTADTGTTVNLFAQTFSGYKFDHWSVNSGGVAITNADKPIAWFTMGSADVSITGHYIKTGGEDMDAHLVTVRSNPIKAGIVSANPGGYVVTGTTVTLSAKANPGFRFSGWNGISNPFVMPDRDVVATAMFDIIKDDDDDDDRPVI